MLAKPVVRRIQIAIFFGNHKDDVQVFVSLVIGELQMQQALGSIAPLTVEDITARAEDACALFDRLCKSA